MKLAAFAFSCAALAALAAQPAHAETSWTTTYGPLKLPDEPAGHVETRWGPWRGNVSGDFRMTRSGAVLSATHVGSFHDIPCANTGPGGAWYWGKLVFRFDPAYRSFTGSFNRCGQGEENPVSGTRND